MNKINSTGIFTVQYIIIFHDNTLLTLLRNNILLLLSVIDKLVCGVFCDRKDLKNISRRSINIPESVIRR